MSEEYIREKGTPMELKPCPECGDPPWAANDSGYPTSYRHCNDEWKTADEWNSAYCWKELAALKRKAQAAGELLRVAQMAEAIGEENNLWQLRTLAQRAIAQFKEAIEDPMEKRRSEK